MQTAVLLLAIGLFAIAAYGDVNTRRIPNGLVLAIEVLGIIRLVLLGDASALLCTIAVTAAVFVATFLLFWRGLLGGGDVKLMTASVLLVGYRGLFEFFFVMSVCGALVALAVLAVNRLGSQPMPCPQTMPGPDPHEMPARLTVPYGVAIAAAGVFTLFVQTFVSR